jgi:hypothetical protein
MTNNIRGEAALNAGGKQYRLLLTLGALAEIESGLGLSDLSDVSARLKHLRASDLAIVAASLMRGGGHDVSPADVMRLPVDLGALVQAVGTAFEAAGLAKAGDAGEGPGKGDASVPFVGTTGSNSPSA